MVQLNFKDLKDFNIKIQNSATNCIEPDNLTAQIELRYFQVKQGRKFR
jgi:hypothetical protein